MQKKDPLNEMGFQKSTFFSRQHFSISTSIGGVELPQKNASSTILTVIENRQTNEYSDKNFVPGELGLNLQSLERSEEQDYFSRLELGIVFINKSNISKRTHFFYRTVQLETNKNDGK